MKKKLIFNPDGNDDIKYRQVLGGNTTNLVNLNSVKYPNMVKLYKTMLSNFWLPEKVDLSSDDFSKLSKSEQKAFKGILSFLVFLDSIQLNILPSFNDYITLPEASMLLSVQDFQESIHISSYQYIIESVLPASEREGIYDFWRTDSVLLERNKLIASKYQAFRDSPTDQTFKEALIASLAVESIYFYNGFAFFYNLALRNLMPGTAECIKLIQKDELSHVVFGAQLVNLVCIENDSELIANTLRGAVDAEIHWTNHIIGEDILGISSKTTEQYTKHLANRRAKHIGIDKLYEGIANPYKHLERYSDLMGRGEVRSNFFESNTTSYSQANAIGGWDDF